MSESFPTIIKALLNPECYPEPVDHVEVIETHISWLLLAGKFAYKIKKPITLPFLDYGSLSKRKSCCEAELRLNSRYAPDIYIEIVAITGTPDHLEFNGHGAPIEFAVKMLRFSEAERLDHVCSRGQLELPQISDLANAIVTFHNHAAITTINSHFGSPDAVIAPARENFEELYSGLNDKELQSKLNALLTWTNSEHNRLMPNFLARKASGHVRECHGDLHLGNIVLIDGHARLFDCIEFNENLRWIDVASDIAFTYMDLLDHHQSGLAGWLINEWLSMSGDYEAMPMLRFYAVYRAMVRAKVAAIRASQNHSDLNEVRRYIALAEQISSPQKLRLTITHGLAGCGKTTASTHLILDDENGSTIRLRSDVERKRLFGLAATAKSNSTLDSGIYNQEAHQRTYHHLHQLAELLLTNGWSVVVDAAFLKRSERDAFRDLAAKTGAEFCISAPKSSIDELRERITNRLKNEQDASEATLEVLEKQISAIEPLDEDERRCIR
ncbi:hypothetical protein GALL_19030 [mine drainage metagenome]|uniref:Aminoglycoside phosphotransferase domain-containing protein n=1 Tax=mine drainage metagenome TaxID=410659 RepID=A0A1J5T9Z2_9ZZZZ